VESAAFISYSREDSEFALRLAKDLKAAGAQVWLDQLDVLAGPDEEIERALIDATRVVLLLSPASVRSGSVSDQVSYALDQGKIVVPVLYRDCIVPLRLQRMQLIDFRADYERGLTALLERLRVTPSALYEGGPTRVFELAPGTPSAPHSRAPAAPSAAAADEWDARQARDEAEAQRLRLAEQEAREAERQRRLGTATYRRERENAEALPPAAAAGPLSSMLWRWKSKLFPPPKPAPPAGFSRPPGSRTDKVHFSVSYPPAARVGVTFIVDVWAHLEQQRAEVERRIRQASAPTDSPPVIRPRGPFDIQRGTRLFIRLKFPDCRVESAEETIDWDGEIGNASFVVAVPADAAHGPKTGLVTVHWEGGLQIARVPIQIEVVAEVHPTGPTAHPVPHIHKAFASYASPDRDEVLGRIQGMQKIAPDLDVFLDVAKLRSGEDWEKKLWQVIPENDVLYLFWSAAAKASPWVEKEWRCGLNSRGEDFIDPVPLVSPEEVSPPAELSRKHFNDWVLAYRRAKPN